MFRLWTCVKSLLNMQDCFCSQRLQASGFRLGMSHNSGFHLPRQWNGVERRGCVGLCFFTVTLDLLPELRRAKDENVLKEPRFHILKFTAGDDFHKHSKHKIFMTTLNPNKNSSLQLHLPLLSELSSCNWYCSKTASREGKIHFVLVPSKSCFFFLSQRTSTTACSLVGHKIQTWPINKTTPQHLRHSHNCFV